MLFSYRIIFFCSQQSCFLAANYDGFIPLKQQQQQQQFSGEGRENLEKITGTVLLEETPESPLDCKEGNEASAS